MASLSTIRAAKIAKDSLNYSNNNMGWFTLGAAAIGGISSLFGSSSSSKNALKAQRETNEMNYKIAQETNAQNYKMWQEEQAYNLAMYDRQRNDNLSDYQMQKQDNIDFWNMENRYNEERLAEQRAYDSPESEVQRLLDAGLNPAIFYGGGSSSAGTSSGISSPSMNGASISPSSRPTAQGATMQAPPVQAFQNAVSVAIQDTIGALQALDVGSMLPGKKQGQDLDNVIKGLDADNRKIDLAFKKDTNPIVKSLMRTELGLKNTQLKLETTTLDAKRQYQELLVKQLNANIVYQELKNSEQRTLNQYLDTNQQLDLMVKAQSWQNLVYSGVLTQQQVKNRIAEELLTYKKIEETDANIANINADTEGKGIDNEIKRITKNQAEKTAQGIIDAVNSESYMRKYQSLNAGDTAKTIWNDRHNSNVVNSFWYDLLDVGSYAVDKALPIRGLFLKK